MRQNPPVLGQNRQLWGRTPQLWGRGTPLWGGVQGPGVAPQSLEFPLDKIGQGLAELHLWGRATKLWGRAGICGAGIQGLMGLGFRGQNPPQIYGANPKSRGQKPPNVGLLPHTHLGVPHPLGGPAPHPNVGVSPTVGVPSLRSRSRRGRALNGRPTTTVMCWGGGNRVRGSRDPKIPQKSPKIIP